MTIGTTVEREAVALLLIAGASLFYWRAMFKGDDDEDPTEPSLISWPVWTFISVFGIGSAWKGHFGFNVVLSITYTLIMLVTSILAAILAGERLKHLTKWELLLGGLAVAGATAWGFGLVSGNLGVALIVAADFCAWIPTLRQSWKKPWLEPTWPWVVSGLGGIIGGLAIERTSFTAVAYPYYVIGSVAFTGLILLLRTEIQHVKKPRTAPSHAKPHTA